MRKLRVAVLMGGNGSEREVSLSTGRQILAALDTSKYEVLCADSRDLKPLLGASPPPPLPLSLEGEGRGEGDWSRLAAGTIQPDGRPPDVVFIALHGRGGEDGSIQGFLETLGIPYTGSGVLASAMAMDKSMTKRLLRAEGIPCPREIAVKRTTLAASDSLGDDLSRVGGFPLVVKPNAEGSTVGCTIVRSAGELPGAIAEALLHDDLALIEEHIEGTEITAGALGNEDPEVLPLIEIVCGSGFYDYHAKYAPGGSRHIIPARISNEAARKANDYAARAHRLLGCRGMSRVDMIVRDDEPYVLEVNTIPGMTPTSLLPEAAKAAGIEFPELLDRLIESALGNVSRARM